MPGGKNAKRQELGVEFREKSEFKTLIIFNKSELSPNASSTTLSAEKNIVVAFLAIFIVNTFRSEKATNTKVTRFASPLQMRREFLMIEESDRFFSTCISYRISTGLMPA